MGAGSPRLTPTMPRLRIHEDSLRNVELVFDGVPYLLGDVIAAYGVVGEISCISKDQIEVVEFDADRTHIFVLEEFGAMHLRPKGSEALSWEQIDQNLRVEDW